MGNTRTGTCTGRYNSVTLSFLLSQRRAAELEDVREELELVKSQATSLENTKGWLERRLNEVEEMLQQTKDEHLSILETSMHEHDGAIEEIKVSHGKDLEVSVNMVVILLYILSPLLVNFVSF